MPRNRIEQRQPIEYNMRHKVFMRYNGICGHCGKRMVFHKDFTVDHYVPLSKGGKNEPENYAALCFDCNQEKYDGVADPEYYMTHAPKDQLDILKKTYHEYIGNHDFLAHDCVLINDFFDMDVRMPIPNPKARKVLTMGTRMHVRKMRPEEVLDWLTLYAGRLSYLDKELIITTLEQVNTSYYMVSLHDKDLVMFSPFFMDANIKTDVRPEGGERKVLVIEFFASQDINRPGDIFTGAKVLSILYGIIEKLACDLNDGGNNGATIEMITRTPLSDKVVQRAADALTMVYKDRSLSAFVQCDGNFDYKTKTADMPAILTFNTMIFAGTAGDISKLAKESGANSVSEYMRTADTQALQDKIDDKLNKTQVVKDYVETRVPPSKSEKKAKYRKPNAKKRKRDMMHSDVYIDPKGSKY